MTTPREEHIELLIIGSGAAGVSAARGYLDAAGTGPVLMATSDAHPPYERPPLSKDVLRGESPAEGRPVDGEDLPPGVELRVETTVTGVDLAARRAHLDGPGGSGDVVFNRLVVTAGASPKPLPVAEEDAEVHVLRSLEHARKLVDAAEHAESAVVIGSGFIGCEAAASLAGRGVHVTLVTPEDGPQAARLGDDAAARIAGWLRDAGVELRTGTKVARVETPRTVHLENGSTLTPDLVLAAVGVQPNGDVLAGTEVAVQDGRIAADQTLEAAQDVWVAGDVSHAQHALVHRPIDVEHWGDALAMGRIAGHNAAVAAPDRKPWDTVPGFWSTIGEHTIKYSAWGDGYHSAHTVEHGDGFTVWYGAEDGELVGVLTYQADGGYERGQELLQRRAQVPEV